MLSRSRTCESGLAGKLSSICPGAVAATLPDRRRPHLSEQSELVLHCVAKLFVGVHHVLMSLLNVIELLLLIRREQGPNL